MAKARRGRPVEYDREETLQRATDLFWVAGLSATSLDAISETTQMTRPSLAGAFGDKEALYIATLERYRDAGVEALRQRLSGAKPLRAEMAQVYSTATDVYMADPGAARGCLLIGTASVEAVHRAPVRRVLHQSLQAFTSIIEERVRKAIDDGEIDPKTNAAAVASLLSAVMHSLAVRARAGDSRRELDQLSKSAVDVILGKATPPRDTRP